MDLFLHAEIVQVAAPVAFASLDVIGSTIHWDTHQQVFLLSHDRLAPEARLRDVKADADRPENISI